MEAIKLLIVDDHAVVRDGLTTMLGRQESFAVVGEAQNGLEAIERAQGIASGSDPYGPAHARAGWCGGHAALPS